jgi:catechol 2,3-dioxygenase
MCFFTRVWNLTVVAERDGSVYLRRRRNSPHPRTAPARARTCCISLAAADRDAVDRLHARVGAGAQLVDAPAAVNEPGGGYALRCRSEGRIARVIADDAPCGCHISPTGR